MWKLFTNLDIKELYINFFDPKKKKDINLNIDKCYVRFYLYEVVVL